MYGDVKELEITVTQPRLMAYKSREVTISESWWLEEGVDPSGYELSNVASTHQTLAL